MAKTDAPVDLHHLNRFTDGDRAINEEVLRLFDRQCRETVGQLKELARGAVIPPAWRELAHRLKGAARGIGAFDLGDAAEEAEGAHEPRAARAALARLQRDSAAVCGFIRKFLGDPA
jgi:HPt (histidine-containing phosphotransfer) domain-containing protein